MQHPDYSSVYVWDDGREGTSEHLTHTYRVFAKENVRLIYKVTVTIKPCSFVK